MTDRNPSKQRRAAQNKAARQALANRTTKAAQAPVAPSTRSSSSGSGGKAVPSRASGTTRGRAAAARPTGRGGRPSRTGGTAVRREPTNPVGKLIADVQAVPGGKGVFFSFLFALVAAFMLLVAKIAPQEVLHYVGATIGKYRIDHKLKIPAGLNSDGVAKKPVVIYDHALAILGPVAIVFAILPIAISGVAMALALREKRRRNFTIAAFVMVLFVLYTGSLGIFFFFSAGGLVYAAMKARQAEPAPLRAGRGRRGAVDDEDDDVDPDDDGYEDDDEG